MEHLT